MARSLLSPKVLFTLLFLITSSSFARAEAPSAASALPSLALPVEEIASLGESTDAIARPIGPASENIPFGETKSGSGAVSAGSTSLSKEWFWRRASVAEMAGIAVAGGGIIYSEKAHGTPDRPEWTAHNGFDESIRDALRFGSKSARDTAHSVSDVLMALFIAEPVIDSFITLGYRDHRWDALWQTSVINMESFTVSALVSGVMEVSTKREKPYVRDCPDGSCIDKDSNRSMPSGHAAFAFTGAGLYCTHHTYQTLYNPATERIICATSLGLAAVDGIARIAADRHYATDVIVGSAIGLFSGFVLPRLLHYAWPDQGADESRSAGGKKQRLVKTIGFSPQILNGGGGLRCDVKF